MKKLVMVGLFALLPYSALAQEEDPAESEESEGGGDVESPGAPQPTTPSSEVHVVRGGDTLWDLCSKILNSPWYWPKIWSYNPQITNPHWIYPGNELRFLPGDENLPTNVEQVSRSMDAPSGAGDTSQDSTEEYAGNLAPRDASQMVRSSRDIHVGRTEPNSFFQSYIGFVSAKEHSQGGEIVNSESESVMLSDYDKVYLKLKSAPKKGENYAVYRPLKQIMHPLSGEPLGYAIEIVGGLTVIDTAPSVATGQIAQSYRPIERGDYVGRWPENFGQRVNPSANQTETQGYIIETMGELLNELGEHSMVFIDRGRSHGVQQGNTFSVVARGDNYTRETQGLPNEDVGQLMVIDVQDKSSTAIITGSLRELAVGDKIEMRKN